MNLLWVLVLTLAWTALVGELSVFTLLQGAIIGYLVLALRRQARLVLFWKAWRLLRLIVYAVWELIIANFRVAWDVLTPNDNLRAGVVAVPLDVKGDLGVTLVANLITLTPGTVTLDVSDDGSYLYVHTMHLEDPDDFRREIKSGFERRVRDLVE